MKQYVVRKYVMANNAEEAISKSKHISIRDVFVNDEPKTEDKIGFRMEEHSMGEEDYEDNAQS